MKRLIVALTVSLLAGLVGAAEAKPLKVFILAGQSNMEGPANIKTFDYIGDDPRTAPMLKEMVGPDGKAVVCDHAYLSYLTGDPNIEVTGKLTAGYGSLWGLDPKKPGDKIGPEFTFGIYMSKAIKEPFLIIKTAWGGKSLVSDFRPPSAGERVFNDYTVKRWKEMGVNPVREAARHNSELVGVYYRRMIEHVKKVLGHIQRVVPDYDPKQGYELAGFVWLQGWNDYCDSWTYPAELGDKRYDEYGQLMAMFIRDVRKDLSTPKMPFVIGVAGFEGIKAPPHVLAFRKAQASPASIPEFQGNVVAVQTAPFWADELAGVAQRHERVDRERWGLESKHKDYANADGTMTKEQIEEHLKNFEAKLITPAESAMWRRGASNAGYHYLGCAKTFAFMGRAFAEAIVNFNRENLAPMDARTLLEQGQTSGSLPEGMVIRIAACLGELDRKDSADRVSDTLTETWEFVSNQVHRVEREYQDGKSTYRRMASRPFDSKGICKDLLDGKAIEIQARKGKGPDVVLAGTPYHRGSRSIEVVWNGKTILDLHETNGPALDVYRESDARAFGALYERLVTQARTAFRSKSPTSLGR